MLLSILSTLALADDAMEARLPLDPGDDVAPIINGEDADETDWPMTGGTLLDAQMGGNRSMRVFMCSSTLIAPDTVMLAAHCVDEDTLSMYGIGNNDDVEFRWSREADLSDFGGGRTIPDWPSDAIPAVDWVTHSDFDIWSLSMGLAQNHDIALLFLEEAVTDTEHAYIITPEEADQVVEDVDVVVVGWGMQTASSTPSGTYLYKQMGDSYVAKISAWEFQVGEIKTDVRKCHGDSGGPSFFQVEDSGQYTETWRVAGVTSHAYDRSDCDNTGGVDTRVSAYYDWIDDEMRAACADGTRVWCDVEGVVPPPEPEPDLEDTGDADVGDGEGPLGAGCGCSSAPAPTSMAWLLGLAGLVGLRRREVTPATSEA